ncbi:putative solute carrier family 22 member 5-like [Apostichopus japonicus]|uniref:Putative solute carrier family 22 member 5-like n=1 Tax=Stichopus japonicus TaxID=307972 RepID=A0A2G8KMP6_STIJA|nr:putative solute carrier family 22 member 5-like [Apostichopus japonicus]
MASCLDAKSLSNHQEKLVKIHSRVPMVGNMKLNCMDNLSFQRTSTYSKKACQSPNVSLSPKQWDLVCERDFLPDLSQTILFCGMAAGSIIAGPVSDKYGRKPTAIGGVILFNIIGIAVTFSPNYIVFVILRFLLATIFKSILIPLNTLLFESLVPRHRSLIGSIPAPIFTIGLILMAGIAYLLRDWRYFNLVMMSPALIIMMISWKLPESARWLLSQGKQERAETVIRKVAKFNKSSIESITLSCNMSIEENRDVMSTTTFDQISIAENIPASDNKKNNTGSFKDLFKPPTLTVTVILTWLWISYTLGYFGFALTTGNLAGDPYLNFFLSGLIELPARILPLFIVKRTGSLLPLIIGFALSSLTMIGIVVARHEAENRGEEHGLDLLLTILALLGKFFAAFVFVPSNLLMVELFPTTIRNSGTGVVQLIGNIGSLAVPLLIYLDKFVLNLPFIIMATASMIASGLCFLLPETLNTVQPETPADLQLLFDSRRLCRRKQKYQVNSPGERIPTDWIMK